MALYRIYVDLDDEWGGKVQTRIGRTFGSLQKALERGRTASEKYGVAEIHDDSRSIYDRLLAVFRNGREIHNRLQF